MTVKGNISGQYYIGGIVGSAENANLTNCKYEGNLAGTKFVGGVVLIRLVWIVVIPTLHSIQPTLYFMKRLNYIKIWYKTQVFFYTL